MKVIVFLIAFFYFYLKGSAALGSCDPLVPEYCGLPLPNSFFTRADRTSRTGLRLNFSKTALPESDLGEKINPKDWNTFDGFSPFPFIITYFPEEIDDDNLPPHWDIARSLQPDSPTLLFDADSGKLLAHFAELDYSLKGARKHALTIWPSQRLKDSSRYIVAIRNLHTRDGNLVKASDAFQSLRDKKSSADPDVENRRKLFEEIFSLLELHGVSRESLQLAWDFHTASQECLTERLLFMRNDALQRIGSEGGKYRVVRVQDNYSEHIYRRITGIMTVPYYTTTTLPGARLVLDGSGLPVYQGMADATFTVLIPKSVANGTYSTRSNSPVPLTVQYGHGLFGSQSEVQEGYLQEQADLSGYVLAACDWWGMSSDDVPALIAMWTGDLSDFGILPDRLSQGITNALALMRILKTSFVHDKHVQFDGFSAIDPANTYYYGNSLGGIMGSIYMATTTDVVRGTLGVAGGPFGLLLPRSKDYQEFNDILRVEFPDPVHAAMLMHFFNLQWSRSDPNAYMSSITDNPLPGTPKHRVIMHYGLGDAQVNILGLYSLARSIGVVMFDNYVLETFQLPDNGTVVTEKLYGFPVVSTTTVLTDGSAATGFDCGVPPEPSTNTPPDSKYDTHEKPRRTKAAQQQMATFFRDGNIRNFCEKGQCTC